MRDLTAKYRRWLPVVEAFAAMSKDQKCKVGAIALDDRFRMRSQGWNGLPSGVDESIASRHVKPEKLFWYAHAEQNLIANAASMGVPLSGCTLLITELFPCASCAQSIIGAGFVRVVVEHRHDEHSPAWEEHALRSTAMFHEAGVEVVYLNEAFK